MTKVTFRLGQKLVYTALYLFTFIYCPKYEIIAKYLMSECNNNNIMHTVNKLERCDWQVLCRDCAVLPIAIWLNPSRLNS